MDKNSNFPSINEMVTQTQLFRKQIKIINQNEKNQNKNRKRKKIINIYKRIEQKSSVDILFESLKENRKILINMIAVLPVAPWVKVELIV